jgi:hypothetical protein
MGGHSRAITVKTTPVVGILQEGIMKNYASSPGFLTRHGLLLRRTAGVASAFAWLAIILGCMSLSIGERTTLPDDRLAYTQEGSAHIEIGQELDVYYPVPYASPPNLELKGLGSYTIVDQQADHFRVRAKVEGNTIGWEGFDWTARGVRVVLPPPAVQPVSAAAPVEAAAKP